MKRGTLLLFASAFCIFFNKAVGQISIDSISHSNFIETEKNSYNYFFQQSSANRLTGSLASDNFKVNYYRCEWIIDPAVRYIKGKVTSAFSISQSTQSITYDLSDTLQVDSVQYHGALLSFQRKPGDGLEIQFPVTFNPGDRDSVAIFYQGVPRLNIGFGAFKQTTHSGVPIIWTLSEPYGAKEWWPCKNGLTEKADSLDVVVSSPFPYRGSSNGVLIHEDSTASSVVLHFKHRFPIASYLVAIAVTNYAIARDSVLIGNRQMPLVLTTYPEYFGNATKIFTNAKRAFAMLNNAFGDYPFAKEQYGQTAWSAGGGMEHQTNSFIAATDEELISHELAHQWFGDMVTCGSWQHIWLNEGLATYTWLMYIENYYPTILIPYRQYYTDLITAKPDGSVFVPDTSASGLIFDGRLSYKKGSYLIQMLRWELGDSVFFAGMKQYLNDPKLKGKFAITDDLKRNLEAVSGKNLSSFFQKWFYGQGYPTYNTQWAQDSANNILLTINQSTSHPSVAFFDMPVPIQFKNATHDTILVFQHTKNAQTFIVNPGFNADTVIFDPALWILSKYNSVVHQPCGPVNNTDSIFPYYTIQWFQNSNNWSYININQANNAAAALAENIPLYLHFSGNGRDTSFEIKNIKYNYSTWLNIGFKATSVFVTTSCFMSNNYKLINQTNNAGVNEIKLFPVPVTSNSSITVSLKNPSDKQLTISLYNVSGQLLYQKQLITPGQDELFQIPVYNLPKAVYFVKLQSESAIRLTRKIIK